MEDPLTGAYFQQFIFAMQWLKHAIPDFYALFEPFHLFLERVDERAGKRTMRAANRVALSDVTWSKTQGDAF